MKTVYRLVLLGLLFCTVGTALGCERGQTVQFAELASAGAQHPGVAAAASDAQFDRLWQGLRATQAGKPNPDFGRLIVVAVSAGERPTGGYRLEVDGVELASGVLRCRVHLSGPPPGSMLSQAFTYPGVVLGISRAGLPDRLTIQAIGSDGKVWGSVNLAL